MPSAITASKSLSLSFSHFQIVELRQVPEQSEKAVEELRKKLEKLEADKAKEEEKVQEVMASLRSETQVSAVNLPSPVLTHTLHTTHAPHAHTRNTRQNYTISGIICMLSCSVFLYKVIGDVKGFPFSQNIKIPLLRLLQHGGIKIQLSF